MSETRGSSGHIPGMTVLETVSFMAWADGRIAPDEVSAARGVATVLGLHRRDTGGPGLLARGPIEPEALTLVGLARPQRELIYATAAWIAMADGILDVSERRALRTLQGRLGLSAERCDDLEELVFTYAGEDDWERRYASILNELGAP